MAGQGHNSNARLRGFFERVERLHEERDGIGKNITEVFAEAKGEGFDVKAMKVVLQKRRMDPNKRQAQDELVDLYMSALGMVGTLDATRAPAHDDTPLGEVPLTDATSGAVQRDEPAGSDANPATPSVTAPAAPNRDVTLAADKSVTPIPEIGSDDRAVTGIGPESTAEAEEARADAAAGRESSADEPNVASTAIPADPGAPAAGDGTVIDQPSPAVPDDVGVKTFDLRARRVSMGCENPDVCGSSSLKRCYTCEKAWQAAHPGVAA